MSPKTVSEEDIIKENKYFFFSTKHKKVKNFNSDYFPYTGVYEVGIISLGVYATISECLQLRSV